jgi:hypothetical protein
MEGQPVTVWTRQVNKGMRTFEAIEHQIHFKHSSKIVGPVFVGIK